MEYHLPGNARIEQARENVALVIADAQHVNLLVFYILVQIAQQIVFADYAVIDIQLRILFLEILLDACQLDFVPCAFLFVAVEVQVTSDVQVAVGVDALLAADGEIASRLYASRAHVAVEDFGGAFESPCFTKTIKTIASATQIVEYRNKYLLPKWSIINPAINGVIACADIVAA